MVNVYTRWRRRQNWSARRLFAVYAVATLIPVLVLGLFLSELLRHQALTRGRSEGVAEARLLAQTTIAPLLDGKPTESLSADERAQLQRSVDAATTEGQILRLRLRDRAGDVIFPASVAETGKPVDDEARDAANGKVVSRVTHLNSDASNVPAGPRVVEVYLPVMGTQSGQQIGVLELYVPFDPIASAIGKGQRAVYLSLLVGLALLWCVLIAVTTSVIRNLRRETKAHAYLAEHDVLTGLPTRERFVRQLAARPPVDGVFTVVALVNIDRFRRITHALGQARANQVLIATARRLEFFTQDIDRTARLGGSDFAVSADVPSASLEDWVRALLAVVREPIVIDDLPVAVDVVVGYEVATSAPDGAEMATRAAVAMTAAKAASVPALRYNVDQERHDASALTLLAQIGDAMASEQLVLHYQPKYDLKDGRLSSVEALVRWQHPAQGLLPPAAFIDAVEQTEIIYDLTIWVLRHACRAALSLPPHVRVAVNVSARCLARPDLADSIIAVVESERVSAGRIILEITETAVMANPLWARRTLATLRERGFAISIDDFGTGQTSLSQLATVTVDELKIDRTFVGDMTSNSRNDAVVKAVIDLGHSLGIAVTAEGVEDEPTLRRLTELGCDIGQGYYFSRPVPLAELLATARAQSGSGAPLLSAQN
jgi:predicted signal transduction protein with EAL and GGDEF domain